MFKSEYQVYVQAVLSVNFEAEFYKIIISALCLDIQLVISANNTSVLSVKIKAILSGNTIAVLLVNIKVILSVNIKVVLSVNILAVLLFSYLAEVIERESVAY